MTHISWEKSCPAFLSARISGRGHFGGVKMHLSVFSENSQAFRPKLTPRPPPFHWRLGQRHCWTWAATPAMSSHERHLFSQPYGPPASTWIYGVSFFASVEGPVLFRPTDLTRFTQRSPGPATRSPHAPAMSSGKSPTAASVCTCHTCLCVCLLSMTGKE